MSINYVRTDMSRHSPPLSNLQRILTKSLHHPLLHTHHHAKTATKCEI